MSDLSDPLSTSLILGVWTIALAVVAAADHALRLRKSAPATDPLPITPEAEEEESPETAQRDATYATALVLARFVLMAAIFHATRNIGSDGFAAGWLLPLGLIAVGEFAPRRFVARWGDETVAAATIVAKVMAIVFYPVARLVTRWESTSARSETEQDAEGGSGFRNGNGFEGNGARNGDHTIEEEERAMIHRIMELPDTVAGEIMVPRTDMAAIDVKTPLVDCIEVVRETGFSRIPVYEETIDNIVGVLHVKDLLRVWDRDGVSLAEIIHRPVYAVPESKRINELFRELRGRRQHLAIVLDEYGGTAGLVTMEDILEEIVGEIQDEFDKEEDEPIRKLEDGSYLLDGRLSLSDLNEELGVELPDESVNSLGGFLVDLVGRVPEPGDVITYGDDDAYIFHVVEADMRRIHRVRLEPPPRPASHAIADEESGHR